MILVDHEIIREKELGNIEIYPFTLDNIGPNSYDVTLGNDFKFFTPFIPQQDRHRVKGAIYGTDDAGRGIVCVKNESIVLPPGAFMLATTREWIRLGNGIVAQLEGRSSWARLGITVHQTGGFIDTGFEGQITLEMTNVNCVPVTLRHGARIGQIVFQTCAHARTPYNMRKSSKYMNQKGATISKIEDELKNAEKEYKEGSGDLK